MALVAFLLSLILMALLPCNAQQQQQQQQQQQGGQQPSQGGAQVAEVLNEAEGEEEDEEEEIVLVSSRDARFSYVFPKFSTPKFPAGDTIEAILGFRNKGERTFFISSMEAALHYHLDYKYHIQNFSRFEYNIVVEPEEETSVGYFFKPDQMLEPNVFGLVIRVNYHDDAGGNFSTPFFNSTIDIVELGEGLSAQTFFTFLSLVAIGGLLVFGGYRYFKTWTRRKLRPSKRVETGTRKSEFSGVDTDWLPAGTAAFAKKKAKNKSEVSKTAKT